MKHFQILFLVINLIIGTSVIFYINSLRKRIEEPFLKDLVLYLTSFNLFIFVAFNYKYILYNVYGNDFSSFSMILGVVLYLIISAAEFGVFYFLYLTTVKLKLGSKSNFVIYFFIILATLYSAGSIFGLTAYFLKSVERWIYIIHMVWLFFFITIIFSTLVNLYFFSRRIHDQERRKQLSSFAIIISIGYFLFAISNLDFYLLKYNLSNFDPLIFVVINISPFIWLKFFYLKNLSFPRIETNSLGSFQKVVLEYSISEREAEIIKLIIDGKSNKEIEDALNISINTVKNHIYNIYKKFGVNSRSQLIRFITGYSK